MANYNRVILMGNLTRDPELRYTSGGSAVANFGIAVNRTWSGQDGVRREETTFVDCEAWTKQAELIGEYMKKGRLIFVEGRLKLDQWESQDGQKRSKLRVVVERFEFMPRGGDDSGGQAGGYQDRQAGPAPEPSEPTPAPSDDPDDDIPF
jgi:single-strand DNA-binding protein